MLASRRKKWLITSLIAAAIALVALLLAVTHDRNEEDRPLSALIRDLESGGSIRHAIAQKVWPRLPSRLASFLESLKPLPPELIRRHAAETLAAHTKRAAPATPALVRALSDPDWAVRQAALDALRAIGEPAASAIEPLLKICETGPRALDGAAQLTLAAIGPNDPSVRQLLLARLDQESAIGREEAIARSFSSTVQPVSPLPAIELLANRQPEWVPILAAAMETENEWLARGIVAALGRIRPVQQVAVAGLKAALDSDRIMLAPEALQALIEIGPEAREAAPQVVQYYFRQTRRLHSRPPRERVPRESLAALEALGRFGAAEPEVMQLLETLCADTLHPHRVEAAFARFRLRGGSDELIRVLLETAKSDTGWIRSRSVDHAVAVGEAGLPVLRLALFNEVTAVRIAAISGLNRLGPKAEPALEDLERIRLNDARHAVRLAANRALTNIVRARP